MKKIYSRLAKVSFLLGLTVLLIGETSALALEGQKVNAVELTQKTAENQIKRIIEPVLERYCREDCKILGINVAVDVKIPDHIAPGFDEVETASATLGPSSAKVKLMINEKVGPVSRSKLVDLIDQYLETLDYQTEVDVQLAKFPDPVESANKIIDIRDKIQKQFRTSIEDLLKQFCPKHCLLGDYSLKTETVNAEEAQYGQPGEYHQDGGIALKIREINAILLMDESLSPDIQLNLLEMARLKTSQLKNVTIEGKSIRFPRTGSGEAEVFNGMNQAGDAPGFGYGPFGRSQNLKSDSTVSDQKQSTENRTSENQSQSSLKSDSNSTEKNTSDSIRNEKFERYEKIERVENGDAVQKELEVFKKWGLIFACATLSLLLLIAIFSIGGIFRSRKSKQDVSLEIKKAVSNEFSGEIAQASARRQDSINPQPDHNQGEAGSGSSSRSSLSLQLQVHQLFDELIRVFTEYPKVAKYVFTRILTEEGIETTSAYIQIFGESIVLEMLRDPSLYMDLNNLIEFYSANPMDLSWEEKLDYLKRLQNRTVAGKLSVLGNRSSIHFDFLADLDSQQVYNLIQSESITARALTMTQLPPRKREEFFGLFDEDTRTRLLGELARIDHLPKAYISQTADHLRRKLQSTPQLNTEALPGSDILVNLLEKTTPANQRILIKSMGQDLGPNSGATLQVLKKKMISLDTLSFLDHHMTLDVVLGLPHNELVQFLKACPPETKQAILSKAPADLKADLEDELSGAQVPTREAYDLIEQKILNRIKILANEGMIDLYETNSKMFQSLGLGQFSAQSSPSQGATPPPPSFNPQPIRKIA